MIGFKFGDFVFTKKRGKNIHKTLKSKKKKNKWVILQIR
jgi:ribosomal protein S19